MRYKGQQQKYLMWYDPLFRFGTINNPFRSGLETGNAQKNRESVALAAFSREQKWSTAFLLSI